MENEKIGCALITCDRPDFYKKSVTSLLDAVQDKNIEYVVINDGLEKLPFYPPNFIETGGKKGVAVAKNKGLKFLIENGCTHLFLMEDDIFIKNNNVFEEYIKTSKYTNILHFNFACHGNHNKNQNGIFEERKIIQYPNGTKIKLYFNILGAFSYYHKKTIEQVGYIDENFYNAMEHVDHTYQIIKAGFHPPFRWFADIENSLDYLEDIVSDHQESKIRDKNFQNIFKKGLDFFIEKNKFSVVPNYGPIEIFENEKNVLDFLKKIFYLKN
jgi:GT2 family glycosyltransferase